MGSGSKRNDGRKCFVLLVVSILNFVDQVGQGLIGLSNLVLVLLVAFSIGELLFLVRLIIVAIFHRFDIIISDIILF
jgi:hypothetical protein